MLKDYLIAGIGVLNPGDILGIQPRYHLRSGFAGLQINEDYKINVIVFDCLHSKSNSLLFFRVN